MIKVNSFTNQIPQTVLEKKDFSYQSGAIEVDTTNVERKLDVIAELLGNINGSQSIKFKGIDFFLNTNGEKVYDFITTNKDIFIGFFVIAVRRPYNRRDWVSGRLIIKIIVNDSYTLEDSIGLYLQNSYGNFSRNYHISDNTDEKHIKIIFKPTFLYHYLDDDNIEHREEVMTEGRGMLITHNDEL